MAQWQAKEFDLSSINNGNQYENGNKLDASTINAVVEGAAYAQSVAKGAASIKLNGMTYNWSITTLPNLGDTYSISLESAKVKEYVDNAKAMFWNVSFAGEDVYRGQYINTIKRKVYPKDQYLFVYDGRIHLRTGSGLSGNASVLEVDLLFIL